MNSVTSSGRILRRLDRLVVLLTLLLLAAAGTALRVLPPEPAGISASPQPVALAGGRGAAPKMLVIPSIGVDADIVRIAVTPSGVLDPPADTRLAGWWNRSARAGASTGQTVITGHNVSHGTGVLDNLPKIAKNARVLIRTPDAQVGYQVTGKIELNAAQVARRAVKLFGQDRTRNRLVLVTCSDYRDGEWHKNTIVFARPVSASPLPD